MKLGMIVRMDNSGLGNQTRELVSMLNPDKLLIIDSTPFNRSEQHPEWYEKYDTITNSGFLSDQTVINFLDGIDTIFSCEIFYSDNLVSLARDRGVKTILQYNYEFIDYFNNPTYPLPDYLLAPSVWNIDEIKNNFGHKTKLIYLPPTMDHKQFKENLKINSSKIHKRVLHVAGQPAYLDRNGTELVIEMLKYSKADYQLVIKSQAPLNIPCEDPRVIFEVDNVKNRLDLYKEFDAMILPRRYGGLCLPMNEALFSGLPVFMTDISPNNQLLPKEWLAFAPRTSQFYAKAYVQYYKVDAEDLAKKIDDYINSQDKIEMKRFASKIAYNNFSIEVLKDKYLSIINE